MIPPATSPPGEAQVQLQEAADRLFYRDGVVGVTVAAIRDESGVSLRRIYELCPSKADLVALWLRHRHKIWIEELTTAVEAEVASGAEPVAAVFMTIEQWMIDTDFRGCGFINTHAETSELTEEHVQIIQEHKQAVAQYLEELTGQGDVLAVLVDGAIVQASMFSSVEPIRAALAAAVALVASR